MYNFAQSNHKNKIKWQYIYMVAVLLLHEEYKEAFEPYMRITQRILRDINFQQNWLCK